MPRDWKAEGRCTLQILIETRDKLRALAERNGVSMSQQLKNTVDRAHRRSFPARCAQTLVKQ
jgi:hypothetical protein